MQRQTLLLEPPLQHESHGYEVGCQIWLLGVIWELESGKDIVDVWFPALQ